MAGPKAVSRASSKKSVKKTTNDVSKAKSTSKKSASNVSKALQEEPATETTAAPDIDTDAEMSDATKILSLEVAMTSGKEKEKKMLYKLLEADEDLDCLAFVVYPKANTPGCTKQVNAFNSKIEEFRQLGVQLLGLSQDKLEAQKKFVESEDLDFPLICGADNELLTMLNCLAGGKVVRSVVAVDSLGNIFYEKHKVKPEESCVELLSFLKDRKEAEDSGSEEKPAAEPEPETPQADVETAQTDDAKGVGEEKLRKTRSKKAAPVEKPEKAVKKAPATKRAGKSKSDETVKSKKKTTSTRSSSRIAKA